MNISETEIDGAFLIENNTKEDDRGFFRETFRKADLENAINRPFNSVQENHSRSAQGVLRGFHVGTNFDKLVYVAHGGVLARIVDVRPNSPTFGRDDFFPLNDRNGNRLFVPEGVANSYLVRSKSADYLYQVTLPYEQQQEIDFYWNSPELGFRWDVSNPILSNRDRTSCSLKTFLEINFPSV